ncbi:MAG TPA: polymer-forming cytoskeletal protein [Candidatus Dormibacteraeota bacterium]|nr:polymer-forming cytoskeletal protein [Candidatus Dormibacteraeota bacterium]
MTRIAASIALFLAVAMLGAAPAAARTGHDVVELFHNVVIPPERTVDGDVTVVFGNLDVAGHITGDATVVGGTITLEPGGQIDGTQTAIDPSQIAGVAPWIHLPSEMPLSQTWYGTARAWAHVAGGIIVLLVFLLAPQRSRLTLQRLELHPGIAALAGVVSLVALPPIVVMLAITIIGIPLIPLVLIAYLVGIWLGKAAIALLVGRRFYELIRPHATPSPLGALVLGLVLVSAAELVPFVGWAVTGLVWLIGLGASALTLLDQGGPRWSWQGATAAGPMSGMPSQPPAPQPPPPAPQPPPGPPMERS